MRGGGRRLLRMLKAAVSNLGGGFGLTETADGEQ
jgi:hypothetical protein